MTDERAIEVTTYSSLVSSGANTSNTVNKNQNKEHVNVQNKDTIKLQADICQPVSVVLERLSQEVCMKNLCSRENKNNQSWFEKDIKRKRQQEEKGERGVQIFDGYKLRSKKRCTTKQNSCCNDTTIKQVFQNRKPIDTWKYKRKYSDSSSEEYVSTSDISWKERNRKKRTKLKNKKSNEKPTVMKLLSHATYSNLTDAKVILTKLEDMRGNKYVIKCKKKLTQAILTKNVESSERYKNLSTSASSINTLSNSCENIMENNANHEKSLSPCNLSSKCKQSKNLKVLLVKLELLGVSLEEQNLASKIEQLTANYNNVFKHNPVTHSNNIISKSNESNIINECRNKALVDMKTTEEENTEEENDTVNQHLTNEASMDTSFSDSVLHDVCNSKELSKKLESIAHQKSIKNVENVETMGSIDDVGNLETVENVECVEDVENVERVEDVENVERVEDVENVERVEDVENVERVKDVENVERMKDVENAERVEDMENVECVEDMENVERVEDVENEKHVEVMENMENVENVEQIEVVEHMENVGNVGNIEVFKQPINQTDKISSSPKSSENLQDIGSLTETSVNNEIRMEDSRNNVTPEANVTNTNLTSNLTTEAQKINGANSDDLDVIMNTESIEKSIDDSFLYTCIACNSSFKEFRALPLHLKNCLGKSQGTKNLGNNNVTCNTSDDSVKTIEILKSDNISQSSLQQPTSTSDDNNRSVSKKLAREKWKKFKLLKKQLDNRTNVQCSVCSEVFDTMMSLSEHIYKHTEVELQEAYKIAKMKRASTGNSERINNAIVDSSKETQNAVSTTKVKKVKVPKITVKQKNPQLSKITTEQKKIQVPKIIIKQKKPQVSKVTVKQKKTQVSETTTEQKKTQVSETATKQKKTQVSETTTEQKKTQVSETTTEQKKTQVSKITTKQKKPEVSNIITEQKEPQVSNIITEQKKPQVSNIITEQKKPQEPNIATEQNKPQEPNSATEQNKPRESNIAMEQKKLQVNKDQNTLSSLTSQLHKQMSDAPNVNYVSVVKFCDCHKPESSDERCIELVLHCTICKVIFRTKECFDAHLSKTEPYVCNTKQLIGTIQRLYCSACQIILYSFVDMRRHTANHVKNHQHIKLFCHICRVRFIGVGPIFNLHWFNHMRNLNYTASAANFPKPSLVDFNSNIWSLITSDKYNYLIVTEHVCNFCNEQFFATNQLENHVSICPKRKNVELSRAIPANSDKGHDIDSELNLRLFCTICKIMFKEKSLFETHAVNHKQHLQPQYICLSMTNVKRMYICNVCANVYDCLKKFTTHWQDHNAIRETFMCYQCKKDFPTLETFVDHSKQCDISSIPVNMPSCQVTYHETIYNCKICNIGFESYKALYQHSGIHNIKFSRTAGIVCSNEPQSDSIAQKISALRHKAIQKNKEKLTTTSTDSTAEVRAIDSNITEKKDSTPELSKNATNTCIPSKSSAESKSVECSENEIDSTSVNDNLSITDADTDILSPSSDVEMDNLNTTQQVNCPDRNDKSNDSIAKDKETEVTAADKDNPSKGASVVLVNSNKKTDLGEIPSSLKNLEINDTDMDDDVVLIESVIINKKTKNTENMCLEKVTGKKEDVPKEGANDAKSNDSSETKEKSAEVPKYLRVKNISELMDNKLKYVCPTCTMSCDTEEILKIHSTTHNQESSIKEISSNNIPIILPNLLCGGNLNQQNSKTLSIQNPSNLQQGHTVIAPNVPNRQQTFPYSVPQVTQQNMITPLVPSYTTAHTVPTQNTTTTINVTGTYLPPISGQPQNFYQDKQMLPTVLPSPITTNSSNNFMDSNNRIQTSNNDTTRTLPNLFSITNAVPTQACPRTQLQDTHSRIKLQNAIHQKCSDKTPNVTAVNTLPRPVSSFTSRLQQTSGLPISSPNRYNCNENFSDTNSFANVTNLQNNDMTMDVLRQAASTFYEPPPQNSNVVSSSTQGHTVHHKPSTSGTIYVCHHCPQSTYFSTVQELDNHLNVLHNYICDVCNASFPIVDEMIIHRIKCHWT